MSKNSLALQYHANSWWTEPRDYSVNIGTSYKVYPTASCYTLDRGMLAQNGQITDSFLHVVMQRRSTRAFTRDNINLATLSQLLGMAIGIKRYDQEFANRTYPSAGSLYPVEVYVAILRSDDLDKGIYHYNVRDHSLERIKNCDHAQRVVIFYKNQPLLTDYPCHVFFSLVFDRTMAKYGERGYRYALLDAGHMGQNIYLTATYLGLGVVGFGAADVPDNHIDEQLGLNSSDESIVYSFAIGYAEMS